jgi:hypothetical protein
VRYDAEERIVSFNTIARDGRGASAQELKPLSTAKASAWTLNREASPAWRSRRTVSEMGEKSCLKCSYFMKRCVHTDGQYCRKNEHCYFKPYPEAKKP